MRSLFRRVSDIWKRVGLFIGNIVSTIFLVVFYFTVFALFALPYLIIHFLKKRDGSKRDSAYILSGTHFSARSDFEKAF